MIEGFILFYLVYITFVVPIYIMQKVAKTITYKQEKSHFLCNMVIYNTKKMCLLRH